MLQVLIFCRPVFSQAVNGYSSCKFIFDSLTYMNIYAEKEPLAADDNQNYPYNIIVNFPAGNENPQKDSEDSQIKELCIVFSTDDAIKHIKLISDIIRTAQSLELPYNIKIIFSYGDYSYLDSFMQLKGVQNFIFAHGGEDGYCCFSVRFSENKNSIISCAGKNVSPINLIELCGNSFYKSKLKYELEGRNLYSLYRLNILRNDTRTALFLESGIPAAGINLNSSQINSGEYSKFLDFFSSLMTDFTAWNIDDWDSHFIAFKLNNKPYFISESFTLATFTLLLFISLFALCEFSFFAEPLKKAVMRDVKNIWYLIPLTALVTLLSLSIGQGWSYVFYKLFNIHLFLRLSLKITAAFFIISFVFLFIVKIQGLFLSKAYSYLLTITSIINIFLFSALDISLFYIFALEYIIIYASRRARRTRTLLIIFILLMLPFIPYVLQIIKYFEPAAANKFLSGNIGANMLITFAFMPFEFIWLKIFTRLNKKWRKTGVNKKRLLRNGIIAAGSASFLFMLFLIFAGNFVTRELNNRKEKESVKIIAKGLDNRLEVLYVDSDYFGEVSRTVKVRLRGIPEICSIIVEGTDGNSILYSDNSYLSDKIKGIDTFMVPQYPPENMTFNYIADPEKESVITVAALYFDDSIIETGKRHYRFYNKNIEIPARISGGKK